MVGESLQWRTELRYRYVCLTVEGRGVFPRPSEVAADGEACADRRREIMHVIGHANAQYSSAELQGMCFKCTLPSPIA